MQLEGERGGMDGKGAISPRMKHFIHPTPSSIHPSFSLPRLLSSRLVLSRLHHPSLLASTFTPTWISFLQQQKSGSIDQAGFALHSLIVPFFFVLLLTRVMDRNQRSVFWWGGVRMTASRSIGGKSFFFLLKLIVIVEQKLSSDRGSTLWTSPATFTWFRSRTRNKEGS